MQAENLFTGSSVAAFGQEPIFWDTWKSGWLLGCEIFALEWSVLTLSARFRCVTRQALEKAGGESQASATARETLGWRQTSPQYQHIP